MLVAFIKDYIVEMVKEVTEEEYSQIAPAYQAAIDVAELTPTPAEGWAWDGLNFSSNGVVAVSAKRISKLAFRNRFTDVEKVTLRAAINANVQIAALYDDFVVSEFVDLARSDTINGVNYLVLAGIINSTRANQILNNPIQDIEKWRA